MLAIDEFEFAGQASHAVEPAAFLNFPVTHARHRVLLVASLVLVLVCPATHLQSVLVLLAAGDSEFGVQAVHSALPDVDLKVFAAHISQFKDTDRVYAGLHVHASVEILPTREFEFARQLEHVVAATSVEYWPTKQSVHTALPTTVLNLPATHAVQVPPSTPV
jgi:hypothetical protein